jgi:hypothetical protein
MKTIPMRTTTIEIDHDAINYDHLNSGIRVVRYTVPKNFRPIQEHFGRLHTVAKSQLPFPYYFFSNDKPTLGLYTLLPANRKPPVLGLDFLDSPDLPFSTNKFQVLRPDVLLKLLLADYFRSAREDMFSAHGHHYVVAKTKGKTLTGLEIELRGTRTNPWTFKVISHAKRFIRVTNINPNYKYSQPYFSKTVKKGQALLETLLPDQIDTQKEIYRLYHHRDQRATLDYHATLQYEETRGSILHDFVTHFIDYLRQHGIPAMQRVRQFTEYKPQLTTGQLPLSDLGTVYLFDNRLNAETVPISAYQQMLSAQYGPLLNLHFDILPGTSDFDPDKPVLILQDYNQDDFKAGAVFEGQTDPYRSLYNAYRHIPKQSINVNPNVSDQYAPTGAQEYLEYPAFTFDKSWAQRWQVCFNQLYLKDLVLNQRYARCLPGFQQGTLPFTIPTPLHEYAFVRRATVKGTSYTTLLYLQNDHLRFVDLHSPAGKQERDALLATYNLDWYDDVTKPLGQKLYGKSEDKIKDYDFILGPGQVIEIEDIQERVLYDYAAIADIQQLQQQNFPLEELKLMLQAAKILPAKPTSTSVTLAQLERYDGFLDELAAECIREISYHVLTDPRNPYYDRILEIFAISPDANGKYNLRKFKGCYQKIGMFAGAKSRAVLAGYQGIWYDAENCFMVGSPVGFKFRQPRAHLIRCFDIYQGAEKFDIRLFLETTAVKFVRHEQFTVYPYFFHLIDLFVDLQRDYGIITEDTDDI